MTKAVEVTFNTLERLSNELPMLRGAYSRSTGEVDTDLVVSVLAGRIEELEGDRIYLSKALLEKPNSEEWRAMDTAPKDGTHVMLCPVMGTQNGSTSGYWTTEYYEEGCWYMDGVGHLNGLWKPDAWRHLG